MRRDSAYWLQEDDPTDQILAFDENIESRNGAHILELCRAIVKQHAAQMIDCVVVDAQTAHAIISVYDNLSAANQAKYAAMKDVVRMGEIAWAVIARSKG
jgi:hypothetical protein